MKDCEQLMVKINALLIDMALTVTVKQVFDLDNCSKVKGYDLDSYTKVLVNRFDLDNYIMGITLTVGVR